MPLVIFVWAKSLGDYRPDFVHHAVIDQDNNIYFVSTFQDSIIVNTPTGADTLYTKPFQQANNVQYAAILIAKMDSSGNFLWFKQSYNSTSEQPLMAIDNLKSIYLTDAFTDTIIFGAPNNYISLAGQHQGKNVYVAKWDSTGNFLWSKSIGTSDECIVKSIQVDQNNEMIMLGSFADSLFYDSNNQTDYHISYNKTKDLFLRKADANGNEVYTAVIGDNGAQSGNAITLGTNDDIYITGKFSDTIDINLNAGLATLYCKENEQSIFIMKYIATPLFVSDEKMKIDPLVFPNPGNGYYHVSLSQPAFVSFTNVYGQKIRQFELPAGIQHVDISSQPAGVYYIAIQTKYNANTVKIIKQ